jgi:hypothetical protein
MIAVVVMHSVLSLHVAQLIQQFAAKMLSITRLWRHGTPSDAPKLRMIVGELIEVLKELASTVGFCPLLPKVHDLLHVDYDLENFGPASKGTSAGGS